MIDYYYIELPYDSILLFFLDNKLVDYFDGNQYDSFRILCYKDKIIQITVNFIYGKTSKLSGDIVIPNYDFVGCFSFEDVKKRFFNGKSEK